jgi:hypothetical protein
MFILRRITKTEVEINVTLGIAYNLYQRIGLAKGDSVDAAPKLPEDVEAIFKSEDCHSVVEGDNGKCFPIFYDDVNYIMTETGKTFAKL